MNTNTNEKDYKTQWTAEVTEDEETGEHILTFDPEMLAQLGWQEGDVLEWIDNNDGSWTLKKSENKSV